MHGEIIIMSAIPLRRTLARYVTFCTFAERCGYLNFVQEQISLTLSRRPTSMVHYKLISVQQRGLGEPARLMFHFAKQPFEDLRLTTDQVKAMKPSKRRL